MNNPEDVKEMYMKLKNNETAWLTTEEIEEVKEFALNQGDLQLLDQCSFDEPMGNGVYKCRMQ
jgi:hypothetical protein